MGSALPSFSSTSSSNPTLSSGNNHDLVSPFLSTPSGLHPLQMSTLRLKYSQTAKEKKVKEDGRVEIRKRRISWMQLIYHPTLFEVVLDYLNCEDDENLMLCNRRMKNQIHIRQIKRQSNWNIIFHRINAQLSISMPICELQQREHTVDLYRTSSFFCPQNLQEQLCKLDHILQALSLSVPYFQGLNSIIATFLHYYDQNTTFWITKYLISKTERIHNNSRKYYQFIAHLEAHLQEHNSQIVFHLRKYDLNVDYFAMRWILGLFSYDLDSEILMKVWSMICLSGLKGLKWLIISIFEEFKDKILVLNEDGMNRLLKIEMKSMVVGLRAERIIKTAKQSLLKEKCAC